LIKLPVAALLRSFPAEHGPDHVILLNRIFGEQFVLDIGPRNGGGCFRAQGNQVPLAVREGIHLLFNNIRIFTDAPGEQFCPFHYRDADLLETEIFQ